MTQHSVSTNLLDWSEPWLVVAPDDRLDGGETQFYAMDGYLTRGDLIIGMVKVLRDDLKADTPPDPPDAFGIGYTTLAWTRDGEHWTRDREPFFDRHPRQGEWDHAHAYFNYVTDPDLIDHAVYSMDAAEKKYSYLLRLAKRMVSDDHTRQLGAIQ